MSCRPVYILAYACLAVVSLWSLFFILAVCVVFIFCFLFFFCFFFFQAEDGIRDYKVTGVQTCALPISVNDYFHNMDLSRLSPSPSGEILDLFKKALIVNFKYYRRDDNIQRARLYAYISNLYAINNAINNAVIWALNAFKESANILRRLALMRNRFVRPTHVD